MALSRMTMPALLALAVCGLAGLARAASPHGVAVAPASRVPALAPAPTTHGECGPCSATICVREPEKVSHTKTVYRCKTKTICLPYCGGRHCGGCAEGGECGKPRQVRVLIKRFVKEEHCESKCKPKEIAVPVCPAQACPVPGAPACTGGRPRCLPGPCELPAGGTLIHGVTATPKGK